MVEAGREAIRSDEELLADGTREGRRGGGGLRLTGYGELERREFGGRESGSMPKQRRLRRRRRSGGRVMKGRENVWKGQGGLDEAASRERKLRFVSFVG